MTHEIPVLIAGGGPIGLALAEDLGRRGIAALLVEKNEDRLGPAKMLEVSVRTMEFCRQLGIAGEVRNWGFPLDHRLDSAFVTDMQGYEIGGSKRRLLLSRSALLLARNEPYRAPRHGSIRSCKNMRDRGPKSVCATKRDSKASFKMATA